MWLNVAYASIQQELPNSAAAMRSREERFLRAMVGPNGALDRGVMPLRHGHPLRGQHVLLPPNLHATW
jgi:hypothetical protein